MAMGTQVPTPAKVIASGVSKVSVGGEHVCVIENDMKLYCWGNNMHGQLGDGSVNATSAPGAAVPGLTGVLEVVAFRQSTCARTSTTVYCWGFDGGGEVGNGMTADVLSPAPVLGVTGVTQLAAGLDTVGAITTSGLTMWGDDEAGEIGNGMITTSVTPTVVSGVPSLAHLALSYASVCGVTTTGALFCWGDNTYGQGANGTMNNMSTTPVPAVWQ
jgi:alpha-tubulin suppressor-like RCC1 family protein